MGRRRKVVSAAVSAGAPVRRCREGRSAGRGGVPPGVAWPAPWGYDAASPSGRPAAGGASGKRAEARGGGGDMGSLVPESGTRGFGKRCGVAGAADVARAGSVSPVRRGDGAAAEPSPPLA
ncbi:hypothetical protein J7F01_38820, partial [Streptomyces sp. ISL-22]|nr:hypothetical protein [Streptomyces sp. ISL-22]